MSGWFEPPPTIAARHVADVPKELYCKEESEWVLRMAYSPLGQSRRRAELICSVDTKDASHLH